MQTDQQGKIKLPTPEQKATEGQSTNQQNLPKNQFDKIEDQSYFSLELQPYEYIMDLSDIADWDLY